MTGNDYGVSVSIDGQTALVGAPLDDENGINAGAAYKYQRNVSGTFREPQKTFGNGFIDPGDRFGTKVAIHDRVAGISAPTSAQIPGTRSQAPDNVSSLLTYHQPGASTGNFDLEFIEGIGADNLARLGDSAVVGPNYWVAGAPFLSLSEQTTGLVVMRYWVWLTESALLWELGFFTLSPSMDGGNTLVENSRYGAAVAQSGNVIFGPDGIEGGDHWLLLAGAPDDDQAGPNGGHVYAYRRPAMATLNAWAQMDGLSSPDGAFENFGESLAMTESIAVVGYGQEMSNRVEVFELIDDGGWQWQHDATLLTGTSADGSFGKSLAATNRVIAAGKPQNAASTLPGSVHLYKKTATGTWVLMSELKSPNAQPGDQFGFSLHTDGSALIVGAPGDDADGIDTGSAYVYSFVEDFDLDGIADLTDNCIEQSNPDQFDGDGDGFGNACDADFNNDCIVNVLDLGLFKQAFFGTSPVFDLNGDGLVNVIDLGLFRSLFFLPPGPSSDADCTAS